MNNINLTVLAPYITFITAIIVAYFTYQSQLRLKSFELLLKRREEVLSDMEKSIERFYSIKLELLSPAESEKPNWEKYFRDFYHENLVLYHKIKGANFGKSTEGLLHRFYSTSNEALWKQSITSDEALNWIQSILNSLTALYGFAHSNVNREIETISLPLYKRIPRYSKENYLGLTEWLRLKKENFKQKKNKSKETDF